MDVKETMRFTMCWVLHKRAGVSRLCFKSKERRMGLIGFIDWVKQEEKGLFSYVMESEQ